MDMDLAQYMGMYVDGSRENLDLMDKHLLALEQDPDNLGAVGEIFRAAHTLKGMSSTMGFDKIAHLTHEMENVLDNLRNRTVAVTTNIIDVLFETFDALRILVNDSIDSTDSNVDLDAFTLKLNNALQGIFEGGSTHAAPHAAPTAPAVSQPPAAVSADASGVDHRAALAGFPVNEFEYQVLVEAHQRKWNIMLLTVNLVPDCLLKAPRAFMVNRALDDFNCDIIKSVPETKDIEEENFDLTFQHLILGEASKEEIKKSIEEISEIDTVSVLLVAPEHFTRPDSEGTAKPTRARAQAPKAAPAVGGGAGAETGTTTSQKPKENVAATAAKPAEAQKAAKKPAHSDRRATQTVRVDMHRLDDLMNLVGELVINRTRLSDIGATHKLKDLNETLTRVSQISSSLQNVVMQVRMVPIEQVFDRFPRMVRDLSKKLNKKINLVVEGKETEMDRTVIDEIGDPMVHLIRNSIDHGIEMPEERIAKGKPEVGTITLSARHEGNNVLIEVKDDGKGVDATVVGRLAVERGLLTQDKLAKMPPEEIQKVIFMPGFSTANEVSDLSGRGVGMDAVRAKLEDLSGVLDLESKINEGSKVTIKLPLTLAILPALMVQIGAETFAIPLGSVDETIDINLSDINIVQHQEVTLLRGDVLPIIRLRKVLDVPTSLEELKEIEAKTEEISIVVCSSGERRAGFMVDELLGQQEIVIKSLGNLLGGLPGIMGATMRGDGSIALILDVPSFFQKGQGI